MNRRQAWEPNFDSRICSWHFPKGDRKTGPTRFDWNEAKLFELNFPMVAKKKSADVPVEHAPDKTDGASMDKG